MNIRIFELILIEDLQQSRTFSDPQEEIFGPVVCVARFSTEEEAVRRANDSKYGLCASLWTESAGRQHRVSQGRRVGVGRIVTF